MSTDSTPPGDSTEALQLADEALVHTLLPPDVEPWNPNSKKIAERRIGGWQTSLRLFARRALRPCGNSRKFWSRIEDDDPFLPPPEGKRVAQDGPGIYAADRLVRMPDAPAVDRPTEYAPPPPQPKRVVPSTRTEPTYTEEPSPAPQPRSVPRPAPPPRSPPPQARQPEYEEEEAPPTIDRRPPIVPHTPGRTKVGRMKVAPSAPAAPPPTRLVNSEGRTATEIREERESYREQAKGPKAPPALRSLDNILNLLGELKASQDMHEAGLLTKDAMIDDSADAPRPKPLRMANPPRPEPAPEPPRPDPPPPAPPTPKPDPAPVNRSPSGRGSAGAGLDDLFGGGPQEGRMRIPKRVAKTTPKADDEDK